MKLEVAKEMQEINEYAYRARDRDGREVCGVLQATGEEEVAAYIRARQCYLTSIVPCASHKEKHWERRPADKELAVFCRQFSLLIDAGVPFASSLQVLRRQAGKRRWQTVLEEVERQIEAGSSLAGALSKQPAFFPPLLLGMVEAGEASGAMEEILGRLAIYFEKEHSLKQKIVSSLLYPAVVLVMALALVFYMLLYVLPVFADLFTQMNLELPWLTRALLRSSSWLRREGLIGVGFFAIVACGLRFWKGKSFWLYWRDKLALTFPVLGVLWRKAVIARYCRTLGTLLGSGLSLLPALDLAQRTTSNRCFLERLQTVRSCMSTGESLTVSLSASELFPPLVLQLVAVAEETGKLETMLAKVADFYEADVEEAAVRLGVLLEPFVIVFLGLLVGTLVLAVMLPVFESVGAIGSF